MGRVERFKYDGSIRVTGDLCRHIADAQVINLQRVQGDESLSQVHCELGCVRQSLTQIENLLLTFKRREGELETTVATLETLDRAAKGAEDG